MAVSGLSRLPHCSVVNQIPCYDDFCSLTVEQWSSIYTLFNHRPSGKASSIRSRLFIDTNTLISGSDYLFEEIVDPHLLPINHPLWLDIDLVYSYLRKIGIATIPSYISYYIYNGVDMPRCLHHDTCSKSFKLFIALSDVLDASNGPYVYQKKSHSSKFTPFFDLVSRITRYRKGGDAYDAPFVQKSQLEYMFVRRGDAFITNQRGIHGDLPSTQQRSKMVLAICFNQFVRPSKECILSLA